MVSYEEAKASFSSAGRKIGVIATPYKLCWMIDEIRRKRKMSEIVVEKPGTISAFVLSDLKPCTAADVEIDSRVNHIERVLFDTGANVTVIAPLELPALDNGETIEMHGVHNIGSGTSGTCRLSMGKGRIVLNNVPFVAFDLEYFEDSDIKMIIGMDVITHGSLHVEPVNGIPHFTFSVSSEK